MQPYRIQSAARGKRLCLLCPPAACELGWLAQPAAGPSWQARCGPPSAGSRTGREGPAASGALTRGAAPRRRAMPPG